MEEGESRIFLIVPSDMIFLRDFLRIGHKSNPYRVYSRVFPDSVKSCFLYL